MTDNGDTVMSNQTSNTAPMDTLDASNGSHNATGTSQFPAARVKRIIKEDRDIVTCSADAVFLISIATELFLQRMAKSSINYAHNEKRKTIAYKDVANVVADTDHLDFLSDIVPQTLPIVKAAKKRRELDHQSSTAGTIMAAFENQMNGHRTYSEHISS
ncbi:histone-fold-containing protein [Syncephalis plumigaleata]|nr:histone-fold-containing protein [Syncephalis plumigaleata]